MNRWAGVLLVAVSAAAFGLMPLFASWARRGMSLELMLALRFGLAAAVLGLAIIIGKRPMPRGRVLAGLAAIGAVGYVGQALCYLAALGQAPSGLVALLFYLYPVSVTAIAWVFFRERLTRGRAVALAMALVGLIMLLAPLSARTTLGATAVGILLALASGVIYALYIIAGSKVMRKAEPIQAACVVCASAAVVLAAIAAARGSAFPTEARAWGGVIALALVSTVAALTCFLAGLRLVGPVRAATVSALEPVVVVAAGAAFLGEVVSAWTVAGGTLVVAAAIFTAWEPRPIGPAGPG